MYRGCSLIEGMPARIYRAPSEIKRDILEVKNSIREINSRLNVRSLLLDIITEADAKRPERLIPTLESALAEAEEALSTLNELREELSGLEDELYEVKCEMGL